MTVIYTDPDTGKKYDRQLRGVVTDPRKGFGCTGCAFVMDDDCPVEPCVYEHSDKHGNTSKRVYFIFKERAA